VTGQVNTANVILLELNDKVQESRIVTQAVSGRGTRRPP
jgi:hypothetical protein